MIRALMLSLVVLAAGPALAYPGQLTTTIKLGPYVPAIDTEVRNGERITPIYSCFFENGILPLGINPMAGVDLDLHIFDLFGSLEAGVGLSFTQARGTALSVDAGGATGGCGGGTGTSSVELSIGMMRPALTYRLDPLLDYFGFPLVPYARVGLLGAVYAFTADGAWDSPSSGGAKNPLGVRFGWEGAVGLMLALDFIDMRQFWSLVANRTWPAVHKSRILEHSYLVLEAQTQSIDSFGQPGLVLTPEDRLFGTRLPLMVNIGVAMEIM
jgi:hypothetical protein